MLYSYAECLNIYKSNYQINKAIENGSLFKLEPGIYSDRSFEHEIAIISKKYPNAIFTLNSAFYYQGLTDAIPTQYYLATNKDSSKISSNNIKQIFDNTDNLNLGVELLTYNGISIPVYSKERLLIELIRYKSKFPFDYYKEIIGNYRKLLFELDFQLIEEYAKQLPKTKLVMRTIQSEVF